jgi:Fe-S cluster assembly protein SufD
VSVQAYADQFARAAAQREGEPSWLAPVREAALARFRTLGFPTRHDEDWHFTSVAPIADQEFALLPRESGDVRLDDLAPFLFGHFEWPRIVLVNGRFAPELSALDALGRGVQVQSLAVALATDHAVLRPQLSEIVGHEHEAFTALNTALFTDGALIVVSRGAAAAMPIHVVHVTDAEGARGMITPRSLVRVGAQAEATLIESYVAIGDPTYFTNAVTELTLEDGARLAHVRVQRESARGFHVGLSQTRQARDSRYASFSFASGAALSRANIYTALMGPGSEATVDGLYLVDGTQHVDHQTRIEHLAPNCASHEVYKGILGGAAHGVFNGKVYVHPDAQKTDGKQTNNNLLLSPDAQVDTKPQLEIFADDVKCTHGATVGRLDEVALFYLKSRGLPAEEAQRLLTYAFAADVLERITEEAVRQTLENVVRDRFVAEAALVAP